jgi:serine/alanine adding enzyme
MLGDLPDVSADLFSLKRRRMNRAKDEGDRMHVRLAADADLVLWQRFVDAHPEAGCMHHAGWYRVLRDAFRVTPYFLMAVNQHGAVDGVLPMYLSRSPLTGQHISSLEDGVLASHGDVVHVLLEEALLTRDKTRSRYLQMRGGPIDRPADTVQPNVHTFINTSEATDKLWSAIKKKTRWAIRQAERQDLTIEHDADLSELAGFYALYAAHMRDLGTPVFGHKVFEAIVAHLGADRLRLYLVRHGPNLIGGMLCIINGRRWTDYYAVVRPAVETEFANYLLYWHVIRDASLNSIERLDLGRSTRESNVHLFKRKWRGFDVEVPYYFYVRSGVQAENFGFGRQKESKGMLQQCWSRLPLSVSNRLGPLIRRQLPFI